MKQLEITTNKRLLIVEFDDMDHLENVLSCNKQGIRFCTDNDEPTKFICKGPDLSNEIAKGFIPIYEKGARTKYPKAFLISYKRFLNAFIDLIESKGWYWGENPEGDQPHNTGLVNYYPTGHPLMDVSLEEAKKWLHAESRTFNPSKCIIFEIL